jgi:hypothetical protein
MIWPVVADVIKTQLATKELLPTKELSPRWVDCPTLDRGRKQAALILETQCRVYSAKLKAGHLNCFFGWGIQKGELS